MPLLPSLENWWQFPYFTKNKKHSKGFLHHPTTTTKFTSICTDWFWLPCCAGWTVNPSPVTLSSSEALLLQLSLLSPASVLPSLWIIPISTQTSYGNSHFLKNTSLDTTFPSIQHPIFLFNLLQTTPHSRFILTVSIWILFTPFHLCQ